MIEIICKVLISVLSLIGCIVVNYIPIYLDLYSSGSVYETVIQNASIIILVVILYTFLWNNCKKKDEEMDEFMKAISIKPLKYSPRPKSQKDRNHE